MASSGRRKIDDEPFLSSKEVAEYLGVSLNFIYDRCAAGEFPSYKVGRHLKFRLSEINAWMQDQRKNAS